MPRLGFETITPEGTKSALITFPVKDRQPVFHRVQKANINVRLGDHDRSGVLTTCTCATWSIATPDATVAAIG